MTNINVSYSGSYPILCSGEWTITVGSVKLTYEESMGTFGSYGSWSFGEDYIEEWEYEEEGLHADDWIEIGRGKEIIHDLKVQGIELTNEERLELYEKVQSRDWRHNSCGGCI